MAENLISPTPVQPRSAPMPFAVSTLRKSAPHLDAAKEPAGRNKLWRIDSIYFCSIIGTCLGTGELRKLVARATGERTDKLSDLEVHERAVCLAGNADGGGRLLHKALDQRHQLAIRRFDRAKTPAEVQASWEDAQRSGDIPGGYWAVLTHRATTRELRARVFGEVHMLSHLVGAANRADIRRLAVLEAENTALVAKIAQQETRLREAITARDQTIRRLSDELAQRIAKQMPDDVPQPQAEAQADGTLRELIASLQRRLTHESARRERAESRLRTAESALDGAQASLRSVSAQQDEMTAELRTLENQLAAGADRKDPWAAAVEATVAARVVLYVGGRAGTVHSIRDLVQQHGGTFLHHDGGVEERMRLLAGDVHRADLVLFPVDCISHDAVNLIKRTCRQAGKRYHALRTSGLTSFITALVRTSGRTSASH